MIKKPPLTEEEIALFRDEMRGVKPLKGNARHVQPAPQPRPKLRDKSRDEIEHSFSLLTPEKVAANDYLSFARPEVHRNTLRRLRQGQFPKQATLDLHGKNIQQASEALHLFIEACVERDYQYILIIHGKGGRTDSDTGILKSHINQWLRETSDVLAFYSALSRDGGGGAVYVLLRH